MSIVFKLIGTNESNISLTIKILNNSFNLLFLQELFKSIDINDNEIKQIKFITDSEQIKNKDICIESNEEKIIFVFTANLELRNKMMLIFNEKKHIIIEKLELTKDITKNVNDNSITLFMDPDFRNLLSIYLRKPDLFGVLAQYTQYEDLVVETKDTKVFNDLDDNEKKNYNELAGKINELGLDIPYDIIINKLIKFSGHLNLSLRSILCDIVKNKNI
jgi:hypothetical protein